MIIKTVSDVCATEWLDIKEAPDNFSFRCLIKFQEHGLHGPSCPYIGTGYWWHRNMKFTSDSEEYKNLTPVAFIPLYDPIT